MDSSRDRIDTLFVLSGLGLGGSEKKAVHLANALAARGAAVAIAHIRGPDPEALRPDVAADVGLWPLQRSGRFSYATVRDLAQVFDRLRPCSVAAVGVFPWLHVCLALRIGSPVRCRTIVMLNTSRHIRRRDALFMLVYARLLRRADLLVFGCARQQADWVARYRLDGVATTVIYNGVSGAHFAPGSAAAPHAGSRRSPFGIPESRLVVGSVGRLAPEKNYAVLVDLVAALRDRGADAHLLLAGDGPTRSALALQAARAGVGDRLTLAGLQTDVRAALAAMDVFVMPSIAVETFSNAALEAMAMERPVVLTDVGGAREMIDDGVEGRIVPPGDRAAMLAALQTLAADPALRARMGAAGRRRVLALHAYDAMVDRYVEALALPAARDPLPRPH